LWPAGSTQTVLRREHSTTPRRALYGRGSQASAGAMGLLIERLSTVESNLGVTEMGLEASACS